MIQDAEIQEIIDEAKSKAKQLIDEAHSKAEITRKAETEKILEDRRETEKRQLESTRFEGEKKIANVKFQLLEGALAEASKKVAASAEKQDPSYKRSLRKLIVETALAIGGQDLELVANKRDCKLLKQELKGIETEISTAKGSSISLKLSEDQLSSGGGVVLRTVDGKEIFNNTLEARVERAKQELMVNMSRVLFEGNEQ